MTEEELTALIEGLDETVHAGSPRGFSEHHCYARVEDVVAVCLPLINGATNKGGLMDRHNHGHLRYVIGCDQCEVIADENRNQMRLGNCAPMLREASRHGLLAATDGVAFAPFIFAAAADEIERLRAENAELQSRLDTVADKVLDMLRKRLR